MKRENPRRNDIDFLITSNPDDFDYYGCAEAVCLLQDSLEDIDFQLDTVPKRKFTGNNYEDWKTKCIYKKNRIKAAFRRFLYRIKWLTQEHKAEKFKAILIRVIEGDPKVHSEILNLNL